MELSDGEKLILAMQCDLYQHLHVKGGIDPALVMATLGGRHHWGLKWQYTGVLHDEQVDEATVKEVCDILDMWTFIEHGHAALSPADQQLVADAVGKDPKFTGFDGNAPGRHMSVAIFLIEQLTRYSNFADRDMNSHGMPPIDRYWRMLGIFKPMRSDLGHTSINAGQIIEVLS